MAFFLAILFTSGSPEVLGHGCVPFELSIDTLSPGVVTYDKCYPDAGYCDSYTVTEDSLMAKILSDFHSHDYVARASVDSVSWVRRVDSLLDQSDSLRIYNRIHETIQITRLENLKGNWPLGTHEYEYIWVYNEEAALGGVRDTSYDSTTYLPALGQEMILFFDSAEDLDYLPQMEIFPTSHCDTDVSALFLEDGRLHQRGSFVLFPWVNFYGISVSYNDMLVLSPVLPRMPNSPPVRDQAGVWNLRGVSMGNSYEKPPGVYFTPQKRSVVWQP